MEETSLDEFLDDASDGSATEPSRDDDGKGSQPLPGGDEERSQPSQDASGAESNSQPDHDPSVASWTPDGETCEACGKTVGRLWDDEGRRVCRSCKHW